MWLLLFCIKFADCFRLCKVSTNASHQNDKSSGSPVTQFNLWPEYDSHKNMYHNNVRNLVVKLLNAKICHFKSPHYVHMKGQ